MTPEDFIRLIDWIVTHTGAPRREAGAAAARIGDIVRDEDEQGHWRITVGGQSYTIPPFV